MERALSETGLVRQFGRNLRLDQVRRTMEHRIDQRQEHTRHALFLVPRRPHGSHMLQGELQGISGSSQSEDLNLLALQYRADQAGFLPFY
jgi:hypothetical protein